MPLPSSLACVRRAAVALVAAALALAAACGENPVAPGTGGVGGSTAGAPAVGTVLRLNTYINPSDPCDSVRSGFRGGRVAAVGARSIIVADTANPAGGFTSADYASFAATFDTLVYPVGVRHFGEPTDLDRNGRVIVFFTAAVNALTPRNVDYIVGGYFSARDLFPRGGRDACVGSNDGELFYMLAPDPSGAVNGNARSRDYVLRTSMGVLAHEFQHLISASRRLYVVQTANFQDRVWLDEGLSHIAEELTYYRASGLGPMRRLTLDSVRRTTPRLNALNNYNLSNLGRLTSYLAAPEDNSPYAPDDSLATRGATWSFLRYAADRAVAAGAAASDSVLFFRLVNSSQVGLTNLRTAVTGAAGTPVVLADWFRDWAVSHYADGLVPGLDVRYTQPSWVFRDVLAGLPSNNGAYPLRTRTLAEAQAQSIALAGGGTAYFRFTAPAGGRATITIRGAVGQPAPEPGGTRRRWRAGDPLSGRDDHGHRRRWRHGGVRLRAGGVQRRHGRAHPDHGHGAGDRPRRGAGRAARG
jgi:hypothetical protein